MTRVPDDPDRLHERVLVLRAQSGDRTAFHELVDVYQERLFYYVQRMLQDTHQAGDILQLVWLDIYRKLQRLKSPEAFRVWLYRIARNHVVNHFRRRRVDLNARERVASHTSEADGWNDLELLENVELVHHALNQLSEAHREVMTLRFLEEMDVRDIAQVLECSEGTAKSRLHYAKIAMRTIIEKEHGHV